MELVTQENITVDRCTGCGGMWFDLFEAEDLIETETGVEVDTGKKIKGMMMDRIHDINCPKCGKQMATVPDREDPNLKFEVCDACHGYFLDAGELRDMAHVTKAESLLETMVFKAKMFGEAFKSMHYRQDETAE
jgi:Zn-finger nucleic acid-binding protein